MKFTSCRPPGQQRCFTSQAVEDTIDRFAQAVGPDSEWAWLFANCFANTLDTTVQFVDADPPDTFVITGDIPAMWLRDSTAQVWPYLPLIPLDPRLGRMIAGLIHRQTSCILLDPYANAFLPDPSAESPHAKDRTEMRPGVWERKWEVDSLCYVMRLAWGYWQQTEDPSPFGQRWRESIALILQTFRQQQRLEGPGPYRFGRLTDRPIDTLGGDGFAAPIRPCGLIASAFRPSDDACTFPFLVPSNHFAVLSLRQIAQLLDRVCPGDGLIGQCRHLADQVDGALRQFALGAGPAGSDLGPSWCYECDGFGNQLWMDDPNIPSLLSLPYLGVCDLQDPIYQSTRAWVLSDHNPYYRRGREAEGVSSPHKGRDYIWPMAIAMRALTSVDEVEKESCLEMLRRTHAATGFMHESFHCDNPSRYSRPWFAWANSLLAEALLAVA